MFSVRLDQKLPSMMKMATKRVHKIDSMNEHKSLVPASTDVCDGIPNLPSQVITDDSVADLNH